MARKKPATPAADPAPSLDVPAVPAAPASAEEEPVCVDEFLRGSVDRRELANALPEGGAIPCEVLGQLPDGRYRVRVVVDVRAKGVTLGA